MLSKSIGGTKMKKQTAIFMLAVLLVSLVPISIAENGKTDDVQPTDAVRANVRPTIAKRLAAIKPGLVTANTSEWRVKNIERLASKSPKITDIIERLPEEKIKVFLHMSRAEQKKMLEQGTENALKAMQKLKLKLVNKSMIFKKRIIASNKLKQAEQNYVKAGQNYLKALNSYKDAKTNFTETKEKLKECKDVYSDDCNELRERAQNHSVEMIVNSANMIIEHLNKIKEKVRSSETMDPERAEEIISEIDNSISELEDAIAQAESAETKDEIKEAAKTVSKLWIRIRHRERLHAASVVKARVWGIIKRSEHLEERLDSTLAKMEEQGINVEDIDAKVEEFSAKIEEAKSKYEQAQDLMDGAYLEEDKEKLKEVVDEAKQLINKSHEALKEANRMLINIVKDIKAAGGEITPETEEDDYEVVEEEETEESSEED